jgi:cobalt transporter subunit CbtB
MTMQHNSLAITPATTGSAAGSRSTTLVGAMMSAVLGLVIIWGVGFSHIDVFHNAAHDTRHSNAFPCH